MGMDLESMIKATCKPLGVDYTELASGKEDVTRDEVVLYLNRSLWELDNKFPFREKEKTVTFDTVAGTRSYDMPEPFEALLSLAIKDSNYNSFSTLEWMSTDEYENRYVDSENNRGIPVAYTREGCFARLWPTPDAAYTISMKRLITISDLSDTNTNVGIPRVWHEIIVFGAVWRALIDFGDIARGNQIKNHQISLINTTVPTAAKEEHSRTAGLEVVSRGYDW